MTFNFELMARYNQQMNQNIYQSTSLLSTEELEKDRGAFFNSIIGTLNHIIVGDILWLKRFAKGAVTLSSLNDIKKFETPLSLDTILYPTLSALTNVRVEIDQIIVEFTAEISDSVIDTPLVYKNFKGQPFVKNFGCLLQHFFNHQTHHRGQVSTLLHQAGVDVGITDLLISIPDE